MSLVRFDFDYNQAFLWRAENTEATLVYTEENLLEDPALISRDISRTTVYPKNKYSQDTSKYFFNGWMRIKDSFPYKQGDMDGGSFVQHFWNYVAFVKNHISLLEKDASSELRFGYVSDNGKRRSVVIKYQNNDSSKWVACVTKDTEKNSFDKRHATLFLSKYFSDVLKNDLKSNQDAQRFAAKEAGTQLANVLGSHLLAKSFKIFFDEKGGVNIRNIKNFQKRELIKVGHRYVDTPDIENSSKLQENTRPRNQILDAVCATAGGAAGWFVGVFLIGPLLAAPTLGLSLIFAPAVCVLIGAGIGMLVSSMMNLCLGRNSSRPVKRTTETLIETPPEEPTVDGGSHTQMAKCGVQGEPDKMIAPVVSKEVKSVEIETLNLSPIVPVINRPTILSRL